MSEQELNKKLAEWAGGKYEDGHWWLLDGYNTETYNPPNFTESLDACFKWLLPKFSSFQVRALLRDWGETIVLLDSFNEKECALALCLAIEKLIDGGKQ